ncbi:uncharacterized protein LOC132203146 [Neocloeon triangulifer]|uniref:uncharacterized protein LOC132203146 n=1 Tax=Neocloeon triangulifer TaxID=2078957 RepID=UPI00286EF88F|nr:uncharacterized protein LOC132203146 [Neocloeon triangulifer]
MAMAAECSSDPPLHDLWSSRRTGERLKDELALYTEGFFYDCTFEVSCETEYKVFKCHKVILARSSPVFAKMLFGNFSESSKDKDDPIQINLIEPEIFDLVMRYVYGDEADFKEVEKACKVYKFSHQWLMNDLMEVAAKFFEEPSPEDVITVHEMFKSLNDYSHYKSLLSIIASNASAVLKSEAWLKSSVSTVLEVFQMEHLRVESEKELFEALYAWGAQGAAIGNEEKEMIDVEEIRAKTKDALKLIRFMTMDAVEFGELCKSECAKMMTDEDKLKVIVSIDLVDQSLLPEHFSRDRRYRKLNHKDSMYYTFLPKISSNEVILDSESGNSVFKFASRCSRHYLKGIQLECLGQDSEVNLICNITCAHSPKVLASISFKGMSESKDSKWLKLPHEVHLKENVFYTISVQYLQNNPVKSISFTKCPSAGDLVWGSEVRDLKLFLITEKISVTDITGFELIRCPK